MEIKPIPLTSLVVNIENPRFEMVSNQLEAIHTMIDDQNDKLARLAEDITDFGLNPADLVVVSPHGKDDNQYNILEGNRRIVALKLLNNPSLIPEKHKSLYNKFVKLNERYEENPTNTVSCVIFENEKQAYRWIKLKHTGENEGIGTVGWNTQQKARFDERVEGKSSYSLQAIDFLKKQNDLEADLKRKLNSVPLSSLQRLISDPDVREVIGISVDNGKIISNLPPVEVLKPLQKIVKDLLRDDFKVKEIYYKDDRLNYIETFKNAELPDKTKILKSRWELVTNNPPQMNNQIKHKKTHLFPNNRNTIIPKGCILHINQPKVNHIYRELKDLNLHYLCNAGAVLFRVFIELTIDTFIEKENLCIVNKDDSLRKKVEEVANYLQNNKLMDKHQLKGIRIAVSNPNNVMSIDTFNAYVHNKHFTPIADDLKTSWNNMESFIKKIWEII